MNKLKLSFALLIMLLPSVSFAAGDAKAGKAKSAICATCHGANGIAIVPVYPNLRGQQNVYFVNALKAYKAGQRKGGMSAIMVPQVSNLSEQDMADLAAYYSSLK